MSKPTVVKLFVGSLLAIFGGLILGFAAIVAAAASGALTMNGPDVTGVQPTFFAWSMVALSIVGFLAMAGGAIGQFIAWIGAVINTAFLEDKTWFVILLVLGLLSFGFIAMLAYVFAGPDGVAAKARTAAMSGRVMPIS